MTKEEFENIFFRFKDVIFKYAFQLSRNRTDAEDLVQEAFIGLYKISGKLSSRDKSLIFTLRKIIKNRIIDFYRKRKRQKCSENLFTDITFREESIADSAKDSYQIFLKNYFYERLESCIHCLDPVSKEVFYLACTENVSIKDIGVTMQIGPKIVEKILEESRKKIRMIYHQID